MSVNINLKLRINKTDPDMIEVVTLFDGKEMLWGVVHSDILDFEDARELNVLGEIECQLIEV